ncbi:MFS transporter [Streptosporangium sp. NBC_01495]|uniref:MFS transporter n=1 Tax=Streptosporangium sp. NBC_01495 TaxID=2903899 RepID=UPI002E336273|nr:MFS transporter [Streptosporangium sp. NBC_01495]
MTVKQQSKKSKPPRISHGWRIVVALAITQTVGYGVLYYAFAVFLSPMRRDLGASVSQVTGAFTLAVLVTGLAAPLVGRWLDRHGGRGLMTLGSVAGTLATFAWSRVDNLPALYAVLAVIGLSSAMTLYEPAFAIVVAWFDPARRSTALLTVTLVAGFASSIFLPLTGLLVDLYGWRTALVFLAVIHAVTTIPLHAFFIRRPPLAEEPGPAEREEARSDAGLREAMRGRAFWLLAVAFVAHTGAIAIVAVHLLAYLTELGHSPTFAASVTGLLGILSVTGRLVTTGLHRRFSAAGVTAAVFFLQAVAAALLPVLGRSGVGAVACVITFGIGFGVGTLARPVLLAERYGVTGYATIAGAQALPIMLSKALGPLAAAFLSQGMGYPFVMLVVAVSSVVASAMLVAYGRS